MTTVALIVPPDQPPEQILDAARAAEWAGLGELWLWEDCFATSGIGPAAAVLAATERLRVGIGLMPVPLRTPSLLAMEIATLARMFPGRFLPGLGHGVAEWMAQAGVAVDSPMTMLREHLEAIAALLAGEQLSRDGRYLHLQEVALRWPPAAVPPLYDGGRGPRTLALAGELADGVILDDAAPAGRAAPDRVREVRVVVDEARAAAGRPGEPEVVVFLATPGRVTVEGLRAEIETLATAGATRVAVLAGGGDGPPAHGQRILDLVPLLAEVAQGLARPA